MSQKEEIVKEYSNGEVTIVWKPSICIHATNCWKELPEVFNPKKRPWTDANGAGTERIIQQIKRCPSGALSYYMNDQKEKTMEKNENTGVKVHPTLNGPLIITGMFDYEDQQGNVEKKSGVTAFCRCGGSKNMPFCDGTHAKNNFKG